MNMRSMKLLLTTIAVAAGLAGTPGHAETRNLLLAGKEFGAKPIVVLDLLHGWRDEAGHHVAAIRFTLADEWKTYWRAPGQFGYPPQFDWSGSTNLKAVRFHWPTPRVIDSYGLHIIGYEHELILPVELHPAAEGENVHVELGIEFGVCKDICIPVRMRLTGGLDHREASDRDDIEQALERTAITPRLAGFRHLGCRIRKVGRGFVVTSHIEAKRDLGAPLHAVFELPGGFASIESGKTEVQGSRIVADARIRPHRRDGFILDRSRIVMTILGGERAVEFTGCKERPDD